MESTGGRPVRLFVYGTLRRGSNYPLLHGRVLTEEHAVAEGLALFSNRTGTFPYAVPAPGRQVTGMLCTVGPEQWPALRDRLDQLEGYHPRKPQSSHYRRVLWPVRAAGTTAPAWLYLAGDLIHLDANRLITSGDWLRR